MYLDEAHQDVETLRGLLLDFERRVQETSLSSSLIEILHYHVSSPEYRRSPGQRIYWPRGGGGGGASGSPSFSGSSYPSTPDSDSPLSGSSDGLAGYGRLLATTGPTSEPIYLLQPDEVDQLRRSDPEAISDAELVYPEFIHILYQHQRALSQDRHFYLSESEHFKVQVETDCRFLAQFDVECCLNGDGGDETTTAPLFDSERLGAMRHYAVTCLAPETHKAYCILPDLVMHGTLHGGQMTLYSPPRYVGHGEEVEDTASMSEYVLFLSDGFLTLREDATTKRKNARRQYSLVLSVATPRSAIQCTTLTRGKSIDLSRFVRRDQMCMVRSSAPLIVKFGPTTRCLLSTHGLVKLDLVAATALSLWSEGARDGQFPFAYELGSTRRSDTLRFHALNGRLGSASREWKEQRVRAYHDLFDEAGQRVDCSLSPGESIHFLHHFRRANSPLQLYEYGSFVYETENDAETRDLIARLIVLCRAEAATAGEEAGEEKPTFYQQIPTTTEGKKEVDLRKLSIIRKVYRGGGGGGGGGGSGTLEDDEEREYYVNMLYWKSKPGELLLYFYINLARQALLFLSPAECRPQAQYLNWSRETGDAFSLVTLFRDEQQQPHCS